MEFNVADVIERVAHNVPDREAVICGEQRATYKHFDETSSRFAQYLVSLGLGKGDHIAIYAYNCIEWIEAMLGCYKIGAVPININYRYVEEELAYVFRDGDIKAVVYDYEFSERLANVCADLPLLRHFIHLDGPQDSAVIDGSVHYQAACEIESSLELPKRSGDDLYVLYTGGTTGRPKGVVWRQEDVVMAFGGGVDVFTGEPIESPEVMADRCLDENAVPMRSLQIAPLMHGAAQWGTLRALFEGLTVVLLSKKSFDPHEVWQLVQDEKINVILVTGDAMARPMMDVLENGDYDTSSVVALASVAAIFSPTLKDRYADMLPNAVITDSVGSSESGMTGIGYHEKGKAERDVGGPRVMPSSTTAILDDDHRLISPDDSTVGWMAKTGFVPLAYYKDEEKSARTFVTAADGKRYVITGDKARYNSDGTLTMLGRGSQCINSGGEKIYPEEVEMALKVHPDVFDCLVTATPDERFGSCVTALVQLREGADEPAEESLHEACESHVARYKLPRRIYYVDAIKRSPSGKADYPWARTEAMRLFESE